MWKCVFEICHELNWGKTKKPEIALESVRSVRRRRMRPLVDHHHKLCDFGAAQQ
jgi:hypothetical protein